MLPPRHVDSTCPSLPPCHIDSACPLLPPRHIDSKCPSLPLYHVDSACPLLPPCHIDSKCPSLPPYHVDSACPLLPPCHIDSTCPSLPPYHVDSACPLLPPFHVTAHFLKVGHLNSAPFLCFLAHVESTFPGAITYSSKHSTNGYIESNIESPYRKVTPQTPKEVVFACRTLSTWWGSKNTTTTGLWTFLLRNFFQFFWRQQHQQIPRESGVQ